MLAVVGIVGLAAGEAGVVLGRDELRPALRVVLLALVAGQVGVAAVALRRSPTAAMSLLLCATTALVASLARGYLPAAGVALAVLVLLGASLRWFPTVDADDL